MNFGPNVSSTMLLITICQNSHSKIPHRSCTVIRYLSAHRRKNFTKLNASRQFESCLSFFGIVYVRKSWFTQHFHEQSWQQYAKDPIRTFILVVSHS